MKLTQRNKDYIKLGIITAVAITGCVVMSEPKFVHSAQASTQAHKPSCNTNIRAGWIASNNLAQHTPYEDELPSHIMIYDPATRTTHTLSLLAFENTHTDANPIWEVTYSCPTN